MKHTSGPWRIEARNGHALNGDRDVILAEDGSRVAVVSKAGVPDAETASANAHVIVASPELHAACVALVECADADGADDGGECTDDMFWAAVRLARAALLKAKGVASI